jgi:dipeptidyl aminopeptidase/acylaminoacyl peptidase
MNRRWALMAAVLVVNSAAAQVVTPPTEPQRGGARGRGPGQQREMWRTAADTQRAKQLYVSKDTTDLPKLDSAGYVRLLADRARIEAAFEKHSKGVMQFEKVSYKSDVDGLEIPAYVFSPLNKRGARGHAAMVWVHGYVHGRFDDHFFPFVKEAVERGYVIIAPNYRGSQGYSQDFYNAIDYGGKEVDDVYSAYAYIKSSLPYVDPDRVGIMGWSHGGFITAHILFRDNQPFKAGAPMVPVTNLFFRLARSGPGYARQFSTQPGFQGMPHEQVQTYIDRSPVFKAANLKVPILVHVATNDCDVYFWENQQMVYTLMALHPKLADTKIYKDPPVGNLGGCGHTFSERVIMDANSPRYLQRDDTPEQIDAWNRTWAFFEKNLNPNKGK